MRRASPSEVVGGVDRMTAPRSRASTGGSGAPNTGRSDERFTPRAHDLDPAGAFTDVHPGENVYPTQSRSGTRRNEYMGVRVPGEGRAATTDRKSVV